MAMVAFGGSSIPKRHLAVNVCRAPSGCRGGNEGNRAGPLGGSEKSGAALSGPWGQAAQAERSRAVGGTGEREAPGPLPKTMKHGGRSSTQSTRTHRQPHPRAIPQGHVMASAASQLCPSSSFWLCKKVSLSLVESSFQVTRKRSGYSPRSLDSAVQSEARLSRVEGDHGTGGPPKLVARPHSPWSPERRAARAPLRFMGWGPDGSFQVSEGGLLLVRRAPAIIHPSRHNC